VGWWGGGAGAGGGAEEGEEEADPGARGDWARVSPRGPFILAR
jgi:hypothetical protein